VSPGLVGLEGVINFTVGGQAEQSLFALHGLSLFKTFSIICVNVTYCDYIEVKIKFTNDGRQINDCANPNQMRHPLTPFSGRPVQ